MMSSFRILFACTCLFMSASISAQSMSGFLADLAAMPTSERDAAVDSFWAQLPAIPWIDGDTAHFLYRDPATSLAVAGDFNGWDPGFTSCAQAAGSKLWYRSMVFEPNARLDYKLVRDGSTWILDPANPNTVSGGFGPNSELAMPAYVQPWEIDVQPGVPAGTIETISVSSVATSKTYSVQIYLPPGYDASSPEGYPTAYFQDGHEYVGLANTAVVFDNLLDSNLAEAVIGVFVRPTNRNEEYAGSQLEAYTTFFGTELVPYIDANYNTAPYAVRRAVIGASFGGNISARITMAYPELFANLGVHSGAFWPSSYATYNAWGSFTPSPDLRVANIWGSYEGGLTLNMRDWEDDVIGAGLEYVGEERPEGHSWGLWRATTDDMIKHFFPPEGRFVGLASTPAIVAGSAFPNPASSVLFWRADGACSQGQLQIINSSGQMVFSGSAVSGESCAPLTLPTSEWSPGLYQLVWETSSGLRQTRRLAVAH